MHAHARHKVSGCSVAYHRQVYRTGQAWCTGGLLGVAVLRRDKSNCLHGWVHAARAGDDRRPVEQAAGASGDTLICNQTTIHCETGLHMAPSTQHTGSGRRALKVMLCCRHGHSQAGAQPEQSTRTAAAFLHPLQGVNISGIWSWSCAAITAWQLFVWRLGMPCDAGRCDLPAAL
jgi:hypothetical protein